jgi:hypothetical protein
MGQFRNQITSDIICTGFALIYIIIEHCLCTDFDIIPIMNFIHDHSVRGIYWNK